ncbi:TM0106 family RecB-like putative nuclease [bacterium]|jgi:predicted RecB family nuclease|nr:TM0106 family RecB-like putative nuclease [bacterium]MBT6831485.1 TM0106 family RecB-like putative nuclease [bacterium]MBT6996510.1 TM0106 family RecB-like putative nuclease [bacterium]MBT7772718.1 TM0106 family RecB-like putative nuclease [bacterium]
MYITASTLYDYIQCPHKVWRDKYGPKDEKIEETNPFVELLWNKGVQHEEKVIRKLGDFLDLSDGTLEERFEKTLAAMKSGMNLIYQGVIKADNLLGIPDLLRKVSEGNYIPVDIKSGMATEGGDDFEEEGKLKKHYAVQLCLYFEILNRLGFSQQKIGKVIDVHENEVLYEFDIPMGKRTPQSYWEFYEEIKQKSSLLIQNKDKNKPAMAGACKLCPWYNSCKKWCENTQDLTKVFYLGRSVRDKINDDLGIDKVEELLDLDVEEIIQKKKEDKSFMKGLGEKSLLKTIRRAEILVKTKKPVVYEPIVFPKVSHELFFDIEDDPTQEFVYLHGVYERTAVGERFLDFTATEISDEAEEDAWQRFWDYIRSLPQDDFSVYYYSAHEKTTYRRMQKKYPNVVSEQELEVFFANQNVIDLYTDVVLKNTDWPVGSYSLKALAVYLGFNWRDESPSGALSIQWFNNYIDTKDPKILERILLYNEDDCKATMVLKDGIEKIQKNER